MKAGHTNRSVVFSFFSPSEMHFSAITESEIVTCHLWWWFLAWNSLFLIPSKPVLKILVTPLFRIHLYALWISSKWKCDFNPVQNVAWWEEKWCINSSLTFCYICCRRTHFFTLQSFLFLYRSVVETLYITKTNKPSSPCGTNPVLSWSCLTLGHRTTTVTS